MVFKIKDFKNLQQETVKQEKQTDEVKNTTQEISLVEKYIAPDPSRKSSLLVYSLFLINTSTLRLS